MENLNHYILELTSKTYALVLIILIISMISYVITRYGIVKLILRIFEKSSNKVVDVLIQRGAEKVYAVDVGTNRLHEKLKQNIKVVSLEKTNARYLTKELVGELIEIMVCDVSFISLKKVIEPNLHLLKKRIPIY